MSRARDLADGTFSGAFSADSPTLVVDDTNNRVGIGIAAPDDDLHIKGATPAIKFEDTDGSYGFISANADNLILAADEGNVGASSLISFKVDGSEKVRILSSGGITFNGDTAAANALDDYEEGTWTPTWGGDSGDGSITYNGQEGTYTKVGRMVTVRGRLYVSGITTSPSGNLRLRGLPFANLNGNEQVGYVGYGTCFSSSTYPDTIHIKNNGTGFYLYYASTKGNSLNSVNNGSQLSTGHFYFGCTYQTN